MKKTEIETLLSDYFSLPPRTEDPELAAVEAALFLEQTLGLRIPEDNITPETLGSPELLRHWALESAATE